MGKKATTQFGALTFLLLVNEPPLCEPLTSRVCTPLVAPLNVMLATTDAPGAIFPRFCGRGVPLTVPSLTIVNITLLAVAVPVLLTLMAATVLPPLQLRVDETPMRGAPAHAFEGAEPRAR